ncbi:hypothetical protein OC834_003651 [Tilletia horrida]|nr:hypothetical protein OC834_003651 [Tilletia horrida]KAK0529898.1 hypothetical protein OC835_004189 [Tilletia horrida]KAK0563975.1 hypothetical protein OC844_001927 [Tilletia horrida]
MASDSKLLEQLDTLPKLRQFDAFPKTQALYTQRSSRGGALTVLLGIVLLSLVWSDFRAYFYGEHAYSFTVDPHIGHEMQINIDFTIAMPCHWLTIDVRDAVGDRLHVGEEVFQKDGTTFEIGHAGRLDSVPHPELSAHDVVRSAKRKTRNALSGLVKRPGNYANSRKHAFRQTTHIVDNGPACRIYGSLDVKKVTGNLHITTLGHGYFSWEHTDHQLMNLSHVIHEFSFGPYFPDIAQPLDASVETTRAHFHIFQYFVSVVPTVYEARDGRKLHTNQYSVTDYTRVVQHGQGVPGIFIKYDVEPLTMNIRQHATPFWRFLTQLAGVLGGIVVCTRFGFRAANRAVRETRKHILKRDDDDESPEAYASGLSSRPAMSAYGSAYGTASMRPGKGDGGYMQPRMVHPIPGQTQPMSPPLSSGGSPYNSPPLGSYPQGAHSQGFYGNGNGVGAGSGSDWAGAAAGVASRAWSGLGGVAASAGLGRSHRHTTSMQQKIDSEEGRAF